MSALFDSTVGNGTGVLAKKIGEWVERVIEIQGLLAPPRSAN
ncbi:MAG TPA: hypothetical protein PK440_10195 [Candidatus Accumulibacter phosphatis]|nr:hypothetical protein [Candidatus Accumulibacter phosphatis]HRQ95347.1 hypothetical protein [Candidatus Accumulibacter phosphatis]